MKVLFALSFVLLSNCIVAQVVKKYDKNNKDELLKDITKYPNKVFAIKTCKVVFDYPTGFDKGTEELYFDEFGGIAVIVLNKKNTFSKSNQTLIWKDKKLLMIDHVSKKVMKSVFKPKSMEAPALADLTDNDKNKIGYQKQENETIAGKTCEVWYNKTSGIKYWIWNKIDLKMEASGKVFREAKSVELITSIPSSLFEIPIDYKQ